MTDLAAIVDEIAEEMLAAPDRGTPASYIPPLAAVSAARFGIAVIEADGTAHVAGDGDMPFSIQSVSKVFALTLALGLAGDQLWERVGREPSGNAFNSIVQLEAEQGIPRKRVGAGQCFRHRDQDELVRFRNALLVPVIRLFCTRLNRQSLGCFGTGCRER